MYSTWHYTTTCIDSNVKVYCIGGPNNVEQNSGIKHNIDFVSEIAWPKKCGCGTCIYYIYTPATLLHPSKMCSVQFFADQMSAFSLNGKPGPFDDRSLVPSVANSFVVSILIEMFPPWVLLFGASFSEKATFPQLLVLMASA